MRQNATGQSQRDSGLFDPIPTAMELASAAIAAAWAYIWADLHHL